MPASTTIYIDKTPVLLERSARARRLNITIRPFKGVRVAVPRGVPFQVAERFTRSRAQWLNSNLARMQELEKQYEAAAVSAPEIDREQAAGILNARLAEIARNHGYQYNRVTIRNQKTRWGSCSHANNISLNIKLVRLPGELRDYILLHELVHTKVKNHSRDFWKELTRAEPRARELARLVKRQDIRLL